MNAALSFSALLWFIAIVALIPLSLWLVKRSGLGGRLAANVAAPMRQVSSMLLSPSQRIVTVEVGEGDERCWLVLGVTPQAITTLHTLTARTTKTEQKTTPPRDTFSRLLQRLRTEERHEER